MEKDIAKKRREETTLLATAKQKTKDGNKSQAMLDLKRLKLTRKAIEQTEGKLRNAKKQRQALIDMTKIAAKKKTKKRKGKKTKGGGRRRTKRKKRRKKKKSTRRRRRK
jgi:hypothetical protein